MNRIDKLFQNKKQNVLAVYCTAGYPKPDDTINILSHLQEYGADIAEIGIPYSDPVADGEVIQQSNTIALKNGMTIKKLFIQLKDFRKRFHLPLILMGYLNPVMQYGIESFCRDAANAGVDGIILPDLPPNEFEKHFRKYFDQNGLHFILLITPETSEERIRYIDGLSKGFIYAVSSSSTTGSEVKKELNKKYLSRLKEMHLKNPIMIGFGISDNESFKQACKYANGAIIGSAFIRALAASDDAGTATEAFLNKILK